MAELFEQIEAALQQQDPRKKCALTASIETDWRNDEIEIHPQSTILPFDDPGRPRQPELVEPRKLPRRSFATDDGRICLLHSIAHIEFNAINIALDAVYRFRNMPGQFVSDWLLVAREEAKHFGMLASELEKRGSFYGAHLAHSGLWDMVCKTRGNPLHRMALVPRVMEARGLDVTPGMIEKFTQFGDQAAVNLLKIIYHDEIGHVRIGNYWYQYFCDQQGLDAPLTFRLLLRQYMGGKLRGPFNWAARIEAGFEGAELKILEQCDD